MPRVRKPARLWLEPERKHADGRVRQAVWVILDGGRKHSTGCGAADHAGAQRAFSDYLANQYATAEPEQNLSASSIMIADVLRYYAEHVGVGVARPGEFASRMNQLLNFWGEKPLSYVSGFSCRAYAKQRGAQSAARRDLQDFRAAIRLYREDGLCRDDVLVTMPDKSDARVEHFTRDEIARLLWYCWRAREVQKGVVTDKHHLRHVVPFILTAVYTGSRSARIWKASYDREEGRPWMDLEGGVYYRTPVGGKAAKNKRAGSIRIPERLLVQLDRWRRGPMKDGVRVPRNYVVEYHGRPADPKKGLANAMKIVFGGDHPYVRHTFRHTCATWLCWARAEIRLIAAYLSMTEEMVVKVYGHHHPDGDRIVGEMFSSGQAGRTVGRSIRERKEAGRMVANETTGTKRKSG